jgi:hypothetical protein
MNNAEAVVQAAVQQRQAIETQRQAQQQPPQEVQIRHIRQAERRPGQVRSVACVVS